MRTPSVILSSTEYKTVKKQATTNLREARRKVTDLEKQQAKALREFQREQKRLDKEIESAKRELAAAEGDMDTVDNLLGEGESDAHHA